MIKLIILSIISSGIVSFLMMKFQMRMIEKWMDRSFEEETKRIKSYLSKDK
ncbi:hypothetical protein IGK47_004130 [Enterococcus sp. AZ007]|uniref:hypothetical protein n=1 Tax=Enterococcus sp. AZ196 TaxID=2774659 RepID=UPI003D29C02C